MTARWVVEEVAPHRGLQVRWQPISLLLKNQLEPGTRWYESNRFTHNLLRVMEAVRARHGEDGVFPLYWEYGRRIHHDGQDSFDPAGALEVTGIDTALAAAFDNPRWDREIEARMAIGLELAGTDIGTPIIAFDDDAGKRVAIFGPVITSVPPPDESLRLWDAVVTVTSIPGFWELKRTRTERPQFGEPPALMRFGP